MAEIPSPDTATAGDFLSAAWLNKNIRDAINFILDPPQVKISRRTATSQTLANPGAFVQFDTEDFDTDNMANLASNNTRITIQTPGTYLVTGQLSVNEVAASGNYRAIEIHKNGTFEAIDVRDPFTGALPGGAIYTLTGAMTLVAGDYLELRMAHDAGSSLSTRTNPGYSYLYARWVGN